MNNKIREFEQASGLEIYSLGLDRAKWEYCLTNFTELVVKECADILVKWKHEPFPFNEDVAASLIKEHFNIK